MLDGAVDDGALLQRDHALYVLGVLALRLRWIGHALTAELQVPRLTAATIQVDSAAGEGPDPHIAIAHDRRLRQGLVGPKASESLADTRMVR